MGDGAVRKSSSNLLHGTSRSRRPFRQSEPPVKAGIEPLRHARKSVAAGCGGPEPAVTRGRHVSTCHNQVTATPARWRPAATAVGAKVSCSRIRTQATEVEAWVSTPSSRKRQDPGSGRGRGDALPERECRDLLGVAPPRWSETLRDCDSSKVVHRPVSRQDDENGFWRGLRPRWRGTHVS